jgi:hypothetical protein
MTARSGSRLAFYGALHRLVAINAANALAFLLLAGAILQLPDK